MRKEEWKIHPEYPKYIVSNYGRVWSSFKKRLRKQSDINGYKSIQLVDKNNNRKNILVHRLVLETFVGPRPKNYVARHFPDQNKKNNSIWNLSWTSRSTNIKDNYRRRKISNKVIRPKREPNPKRMMKMLDEEMV